MKKFIFPLFIYVLVFFSTSTTNAQQQVASVAHFRHTITSKALGEERTILVRVPPTYERSTQRFPVVLMLDAHAPQNGMMASIIESQAFAGTMPEMILVGIQNTNRGRDLTPTKTERQDSGGGDKFLDFIEQEVLPLVDKNYRTEPYRVFVGHSLGGLTVVYTMLSRPHLFGGYIAASPVLHWDNNFLIKKSDELFKTQKEFKKSLFISLGDEPTYLNGFNSYKDLLKKNSPSGLEYEFQHWTDEDHGSVVMRTYLAGMRKIFAGWRINASVENLAALKAHYSQLSKRYAYEIKPPENMINQFGYALFRSEKIDDAIEAFEENAKLYPNSANVYDSLAEALEKKGVRSKALANYEKAYKMAEQKGEAQLAQSAKANFDRLKNAN
ncbi:MAG: alpha/beta hydrolase-fold protein [Pyrinomonadaceae bacterium]